MATVEINDLVICQQHTLEVCDDCSFDGREENDAFYGFETIDRDAVEVPSVTLDDNGVYLCNKHHSGSCSQCFCWKKQITRARAQAKKAGRG